MRSGPASADPGPLTRCDALSGGAVFMRVWSVSRSRPSDPLRHEAR